MKQPTMKYLIIIALALPGTLLTVHAAPQTRLLPLSEVWRRGTGTRLDQPAPGAALGGRVCLSLETNGRMGAMLFGTPENEVLVANHCRLVLCQPYFSLSGRCIHPVSYRACPDVYPYSLHQFTNRQTLIY